MFKVKRKPEFRKTIKWSTFRDGFPNLFIEDVKDMAGKDGELYILDLFYLDVDFIKLFMTI